MFTRRPLDFGNIALAAVVILLAAPPAAAGELVGRVKVIDGDSLTIAGKEIRLHGIDAPEFNQTCTIDGTRWQCGRSATSALRQMVANESVRCAWTMHDRYGRALATCFINGSNLNARLVATGMALAYTRYSDRYTREQDAARSAQLGLWRSEFQPPWRWRSRFKRSTPR